MVTIAICDDEDGQRLEIAKLLGEYRAARPEAKLRETAFSSSVALLEQVRKTGGFDLYLLDVIMPEQDGIALGLELRELDRGAVIIYLTSSPDYAVESYRARAFYYLLKPVERERFFAVLDEAMELIRRERDTTVPVKTKDGLQMLPVRAIQYGERAERCAVYMLADGSRVTTSTVFSGDTTVRARWSRTASAPETNFVSIPPSGHGKIITADRFAAEGDRVNLSAHPDKGYALASITVTAAGGKELTLREKGDGKFSFTMPDRQVKVIAEFEKTEK